MGLVISHGSFEGGYIGFNIFRKSLLAAIGGSYPPHNNEKLSSCRWYWREDGEESENYNKSNRPGLYEFFCHSDCDGEIEIEKVKLLHDELKQIMPLVEKYDKENQNKELLKMTNKELLKMTNKLIKGCESAISKNENLEFY